MEKKYREIQANIGSTIENTVDLLSKYQKTGELVCCKFNTVMLYSDTVSVDSAYKQITGRTKEEFDNDQKQRMDAYKKEKQEHKEKIPELSKMWMEKGRVVLSEDKWALWDKIVPIRLGDLYQGMELGACLDIVSILNNGGTLDEAKQKIESQGHSGMSFGLVCSMVNEFAERGSEFIQYVR